MFFYCIGEPPQFLLLFHSNTLVSQIWFIFILYIKSILIFTSIITNEPFPNANGRIIYWYTYYIKYQSRRGRMYPCVYIQITYFFVLLIHRQIFSFLAQSISQNVPKGLTWWNIQRDITWYNFECTASRPKSNFLNVIFLNRDIHRTKI